MKLTKAIEILTELSVPGSPDLEPDDFNAIKLGNEALKRLHDHRDEVYFRYDLPLPGETKE